jgi:hypothetical protein
MDVMYHECQMKKDGEFWLFCRKSKAVTARTMKEHGGAQMQLHSFLSLILDGGEVHVVDLTNFHVTAYLLN